MSNGNKVSLDDMRRILGMQGQQPEPQEVKAEALIDDEGKLKIYNSTLAKLGEEVTEHAKKALQPALVKVIATTTSQEIDKLSGQLNSELSATKTELLELAESVRPIEIRSPKGTKKITGVRHHNFENLLKIVSTGEPVLMVGPAGTGKTQGAQQVSEALDLKFYSISVGSQTSKSDLQGYLDATHHYVRTQFREAYEHGGVFLLDEADAGNSNVLILLNAALSNGYMAFPDGMVEAHPDFRMIATANTFGHGANRQYVGRNQLDAATLDRFVVLTWDIDDKVETHMAGTSEDGKRWLKAVKAVRKRVTEELELRVVVSPRATKRGAQLLAAGMPYETVLQVALVGNMPASEKKELENLANAAWNSGR